MIISCQNESSLHLRAVHCHLILWEQPFFMVNLTDEKETEITKKKSKIRSTKTKNLLRSKKNLLQRTSRWITTGGPSFRNNQDNYRTRESKMWFTRKSKFQYICPWKRYKCSFCQNQKRSKPLDDYFIEILQEKTKHSTKTFDNVFEELQQCNLMTFGPLLRL